MIWHSYATYWRERLTNTVHERHWTSVKTQIRWLKKGIRRLLLDMAAICLGDML